MSRRKLKEQIKQLKAEREEILYSKHLGVNAEMADLILSNVEYQIVCLEDKLDFENRLMVFKLMLLGYVVTAIGLITTAILWWSRV